MDKQIENVMIIGAGGGIGAAMVEGFVNDGKRVFATARDLTAYQSSIPSCLRQDADRFMALAMDVTQQDTIASCFDTLATKTNKLNLLINCSGLLHSEQQQPEKRLEDANANAMLNSFAVNSVGPLLIARYAFPFFKHRETGILANLSARVGSISDNRLGGWYSYRASKAAQNMITKNISIELKRRSPGTICVGLHPGTVDTRLSKPFRRGVSETQLKTPRESAAALYQVIQHLQPEDSGKVFAWDGSEIPA